MYTVALAFAAGLSVAQTRAPLDAVTTIINAFRDHPIVALDEPHGDRLAHAFRLELIRDQRFISLVDDIVVEFGNSRYQELMDQFVAGESVADADLRKVWQDTTQAHAIWDRPIYEDFFKAVRDLNSTMGPGHRLRVLLGDPPIEWEAVRTAEDRRKWLAMGRTRFPAEVIRREVLARGRRALVVYGALHLIRQNMQGTNLIEYLEKDGGIRAFVVLTHPFAALEALGIDPASWQSPRIALTKGSSLENQLDAILYLGPAAARSPSRLDAALCGDVGYRRMRVARMTLAGAADAEEQFAKECSPER